MSDDDLEGRMWAYRIRKERERETWRTTWFYLLFFFIVVVPVTALLVALAK